MNQQYLSVCINEKRVLPNSTMRLSVRGDGIRSIDWCFNNAFAVFGERRITI